ncbi:hypothetical protein GCM10022140_26810 [Rhodococcus aetherivorans]
MAGEIGRFRRSAPAEIRAVLSACVQGSSHPGHVTGYAGNDGAGWRCAPEVGHRCRCFSICRGQSATWFTTPAGEHLDAAAAEYERGFLTGWVEYLRNRR